MPAVWMTFMTLVTLKFVLLFGCSACHCHVVGPGPTLCIGGGRHTRVRVRGWEGERLFPPKVWFILYLSGVERFFCFLLKPPRSPRGSSRPAEPSPLRPKGRLEAKNLQRFFCRDVVGL